MSSQQSNTHKLDITNLPATTLPGPTSPQHEKDAARAMSATDSWKPTFGRRQSYHKEDQKHALQMSGVQDLKEGPGFSERK
ncbi:hypothetical protein GGS26DRAFT_569199 [Hypomontagnella submonticulosa]|nr:hypothetical protein GGS26DRAFT_569199 [Hypomontagnella submonticulosa]